jgi:hypothetical protein
MKLNIYNFLKRGGKMMINIKRKISEKTKSRIMMCMIGLILLIVGTIQYRTMRTLYDMKLAYQQKEDIQVNSILNGSDAIDDIQNSTDISKENDASYTRDSVTVQILRDTKDIIMMLDNINQHFENKRKKQDMDTDTLEVGT